MRIKYIAPKGREDKHMKLSKKRIEKMILEFGRGRIFTDYTDEEIFQLGMCKALEILNIEIEEIKEP